MRHVPYQVHTSCKVMSGSVDSVLQPHTSGWWKEVTFMWLPQPASVWSTPWATKYRLFQDLKLTMTQSDMLDAPGPSVKLPTKSKPCMKGQPTPVSGHVHGTTTTQVSPLLSPLPAHIVQAKEACDHRLEDVVSSINAFIDELHSRGSYLNQHFLGPWLTLLLLR